MSNEIYLTLDVGGSKYIVALLSREGEIIARRGGVWKELTAEGVLSQLLGEARILMEETGIKPVACGVTIPGLADPKRGMWVEAQFSGIRDFAICDEIEKALGIPAYCENDGQAYGLAEMVFGCCKDVDDFLFVNVSNGIGGAIISGGRLLAGCSNFAGEIGHCNLIPGGRPCNCGQKGCLETYAAAAGIAKNYEELGGAPDENGKPAQAKLIAERARAGEQAAIETFEMEGRYLGRIIAMAVNLLNPKRIVIGGGVSLAFDLFKDSLERTLREQIYAYANSDFDVLPTPLGYEAGLYSAAAIAITQREKLFD